MKPMSTSNSQDHHQSTSRETKPDSETRSFVEYYGLNAGSCGYCKGSNSSGRDDHRLTFDMMAHKLTVSDYQHLLDLSWRRSGDYCYHPLNDRTCCPNYPISCKALEFKLRRSQRKCIESLNNFLIGDDIGDKIILKHAYDNSCNHPSLSKQPRHQTQDAPPSKYQSRLDKRGFDQMKISSKAKDKRFVKSCERKVKLYNISLEEAILRVKERPGRCINKLKGTPSLENYLYPIPTGEVKCVRAKHRLEIRMNHVDSQESKKLRLEENNLVQKYQKAVHNEENKEWTMSRYCRFLVDSPLISKPIENFSYISASNDDIDDSLSVTPGTTDYLLMTPPKLPTSYGTYHCSYHLDDKLIAVGVLDILPKCVTTVYFFYDPDYEKLNLGIYSALVEISMVRQIASYYNGLGENRLIYYYLGFYVHECKKMSYKTRFKPSYLLCSETCRYVPTEECLMKLVDKKFAKFSDESSNIFQRDIELETILKICISLSGNQMSILDYLSVYRKRFGDNYMFSDEVYGWFLQYARLVGDELVSSMVLKIDSVHRTLIIHELNHQNSLNNEKKDETTSD